MTCLDRNNEVSRRDTPRRLEMWGNNFKEATRAPGVKLYVRYEILSQHMDSHWGMTEYHPQIVTRKNRPDFRAIFST